MRFLLLLLVATTAHASETKRIRRLNAEDGEEEYRYLRFSSRSRPLAISLRTDSFKDILFADELSMSLPTDSPVKAPTNPPTEVPTKAPVVPPTPPLTPVPTNAPVSAPTDPPVTAAPTVPPTPLPTRPPVPDIVPTAPPTIAPIPSPTPAPTDAPVAVPTLSPTLSPTTLAPTVSPTMAPTQLCNMTPDLRALLLRVRINAVSSMDDLMTPGTPQFDALEWITNLDTRYVCPDDPTLKQRYSLAAFYYSTRGDRWNMCDAPDDFSNPLDVAAANARCMIEPIPGSGSDAWLSPSNECLWGGVICDNAGNVERIDIERNGLSGSISTELKELSLLRFLILENGVISGVIPSQLGTLTDLEVIDLNFNLIAGRIPNQIYDLTNLRQLDLNDNALIGSISTEIGQLQSLTFLQVHRNAMTGTIPTELGSLNNLEAATFQENSFQGTMPSSVCALVDAGGLTTLTSDCSAAAGRESPPFVECSCCTQCF